MRNVENDARRTGREVPVSTESVDGFLDRLADGSPVPGGGAAAGLQAALGAALVAMAARCTPAERFPESSPLAGEIARRADTARGLCRDASTADEKAFAQVASAYRLPRDNDEQRQDRAAAIQEAMEHATQPPLDVLEQCERILDLAERLAPIANPNALADLATGVEAVRAACAASRLTVQVNAGSIDDTVVRSRLRSRMGDVDGTLARLHRLSDTLSGRVTGS
jgi:formiminotetrahydrofolate cyclodeaminase